MQHPFEKLKGEYTQLLAAMVVREECRHAVDEAAIKLIGYKTRYQPVTAAIGVPEVFIATSFEREASSNFNLSPAQGDPWRKVSRHVPAGRGPFPSWIAAALDAYCHEGLDKIGAGHWTWELICYYGELFNGFGYRDYHRMHTPYLWGGTNIQSIGKYTSDGKFDDGHMDTQLGMIPIAKRMIELDPEIAFAAVAVIPPPETSGLNEPDKTGVDTGWVQETLNKLGWQPPLDVDNNYGAQTMHAVQHFQKAFGLAVDYAGEETVKALRAAIAAIEDAT